METREYDRVKVLVVRSKVVALVAYWLERILFLPTSELEFETSKLFFSFILVLFLSILKSLSIYISEIGMRKSDSHQFEFICAAFDTSTLQNHCNVTHFKFYITHSSRCVFLFL